MNDLRIVKHEWKSGKSKKTEKQWTGLEITLQGSEKFTVTSLLFLNDSQYQMLGIEKPKA